MDKIKERLKYSLIESQFYFDNGVITDLVDELTPIISSLLSEALMKREAELKLEHAKRFVDELNLQKELCEKQISEANDEAVERFIKDLINRYPSYTEEVVRKAYAKEIQAIKGKD